MPLIMFESEEDSQKVIKKANIWITKHPKHIIKWANFYVYQEDRCNCNAPKSTIYHLLIFYDEH